MGNDFGKAYAGWYDNVELPFVGHLNKVFRESAANIEAEL